MRVTIGLGLLFAGCAGALAQDASPPLRAMPALPAATLPATMPRQNEDALNRQAAMDKRMDARTRRAIGSVCQGCGGSAGRPSRARLGGSADGQPSEVPVADPAQAPLD